MLKLGLADVVGTAEGASESADGLAETDGEDDGMLLGATDGPELGRADGALLGTAEGTWLGCVLKLGLADVVGIAEGASESTDGLAETDGENDGMLLGATDGPELGKSEGD